MLHVATTPGGGPAVQGELDLGSAPALEAFLANLDGDHEVDLSGVTFFDSSALRVFLTIRRRNAKLRIVNPSESVLTVLEITGTLDYLVYGREIGW
jgi:anti-anti-sigma factor